MEENQVELQEMEKEISPVLIKAEKYAVNNLEDVENASVFLKQIKDMEKIVEDKRLTFTKPLNESLKNINDTFKKMREPLELAREMVTKKILVWKRVENERIAAEQAAARKRQQEEAEARAKEMADGLEPVITVIKAPITLAPVENKIGNVQTVKRWVYEVVDFSQLPDYFKMVNPVTINNEIKIGTREIKGLRIYQEETLSIVNR